jgi:hypothetical protein
LATRAFEESQQKRCPEAKALTARRSAPDQRSGLDLAEDPEVDESELHCLLAHAKADREV